MSFKVTPKPAHRLGNETAKIPDRELMDRLAHGDVEVLGELYLRYGGMVRSAIVRTAPELPMSVLDELTQDVFIAVRDSAARYNELSKFKSWLYAIAVKKGQAWRRNTWLRRKLLSQYEGEPVGMAQQVENRPDRAVALRRAVIEALLMLPKKQREVLILSAVEGFSAEEIAQSLGMKVATVRTWLHRSRKKLKSSIRAEGWLADLENE